MKNNTAAEQVLAIANQVSNTAHLPQPAAAAAIGIV